MYLPAQSAIGRALCVSGSSERAGHAALYGGCCVNIDPGIEGPTGGCLLKEMANVDRAGSHLPAGCRGVTRRGLRERERSAMVTRNVNTDHAAGTPHPGSQIGR